GLLGARGEQISRRQREASGAGGDLTDGYGLYAARLPSFLRASVRSTRAKRALKSARIDASARSFIARVSAISARAAASSCSWRAFSRTCFCSSLSSIEVSVE